MTSVVTSPEETAAYSLHSNGRAERIIQTLKGAVKRMVVDTNADWTDRLPLFVNSIQAGKAEDEHNSYELGF